MGQRLASDTTLRPSVGTALTGQGVVVAHERVVDSLGRFHGLLRLVVEDERDTPDTDVWEQALLLHGARVLYAGPDLARSGRLVILYKLPA